MLETKPRQWHRDGYLVSTEQALLDPAAINEALGSDMIYWAKALERDELMRMLKNSLCFGLYRLPESTAEIAGRKNPLLIGFARLVTDDVSFAYLSDVYVLKDHQGKGLGSWLIDCINETLNAWPALRRSMLLTSNGPSIEFYRQRMGMEVVTDATAFKVMSKKGEGSPMPN